MTQHTRDLRVRRFRPLLPPAILIEELPLSDAGATTVTRGRREVGRIPVSYTHLTLPTILRV